MFAKYRFTIKYLIDSATKIQYILLLMKVDKYHRDFYSSSLISERKYYRHQNCFCRIILNFHLAMDSYFYFIGRFATFHQFILQNS